MHATTSSATIINRGRGPEIAGTRITVYDVMDYVTDGWHRDEIARLFRLSSRDIQAAFDYIEEHRDRVNAEYQRILERHLNYEYPPDVQEKLDHSRGTARKRLEEIRCQRK
jgi:uncharacterized protein (DUF433 family)